MWSCSTIYLVRTILAENSLLFGNVLSGTVLTGRLFFLFTVWYVTSIVSCQYRKGCETEQFLDNLALDSDQPKVVCILWYCRCSLTMFNSEVSHHLLSWKERYTSFNPSSVYFGRDFGIFVTYCQFLGSSTNLNQIKLSLVLGDIFIRLEPHMFLGYLKLQNL